MARVVSRCLEKLPGSRYRTARELYDELNTLRTELQSDALPREDPADVASVAVMPFTDMSPAKDHDWFCEGMAEELINGLSGVAGLRVAARASAFQLKGQDIRQIGELLNVRTVLDGSVRTAGTKLRVTAQLNNTSDGYQVWSKRYDRDMDDVFAVQDDIASDIVGALEVELGGAEAPRVTRQTDNVEAYHLYLRGRHHFFRRTRQEMEKSQECFRQALEKDPNYALALDGAGRRLLAQRFLRADSGARGSDALKGDRAAGPGGRRRVVRSSRHAGGSSRATTTASGTRPCSRPCARSS